MEITHNLLATEFRKSRAYELDTQTVVQNVLLRKTLEMESGPATVRCTSIKETGHSSYEILFSWPPPIIGQIKADLCAPGKLNLTRQKAGFRNSIQIIYDWVQGRLPISLTDPIQPFKPRVFVWVKKCNLTSMGCICQRPHTVNRFTPIAVKVVRTLPWSHHSWLKLAA